jgi:o-succinylbenzoate synthase
MRIKQIVILIIKMPLVSPFTVSFGTFTDRTIAIVRIHTDEGLIGYGECAAFEDPYYLPNFLDEEILILEKYLAPRLIKHSSEISDLSDVHTLFKQIKGHNFAKASLEFAMADLFAQEQSISLKALFGGVKEKIEVGESIGIKTSIENTLKEINTYLEEGVKRIKIKIKRGWDLELIQAIRSSYPKIDLMLDGNADYTKDDIEHLIRLDQWDLFMLEQPLEYNNILDHAKLQKQMRTMICLDESVIDLESAKQALALKACKTINIKPGRVGGPIESIKIHDFCASNNMGVWCGGLLETGIGRAHNIAIASLQNFTYPADMSTTKTFYKTDLVKNPYEIINGAIQVPNTPGLGFIVDEHQINKMLIEKKTITSNS